MGSDFIIDVNESDFEYEVLAFSQNTPVVVDFWAAWCQPCKVLSPLLENLAQEASGAFRLAKVDVEANPNLAMQFGIRTVPTIKAFSTAQIVAEFVGDQPEERVRSFITNITPPTTYNLELEKGQSLLAKHQWHEANQLFSELLDQHPGDPALLLGMAKSLLGSGYVFEALLILRNFPPSREYAKVDILLPYAESLSGLKQNRLSNETDLDTAFSNSIRIAANGNIYASLDGLLDIIKQNRRFRGGKAREVFVALLELLGDEDSQVLEYRKELANALF
ncbi:MAG: hypothetical protein BGO78_04160 [Chloroflexi bacterium 44-23]|nr:MAG: hypothetical protein BGO78_04160 [Chloroflexi bacterium 44-23]